MADRKKKKDVVETIVSLLDHEAPERRAAAAIVLGELAVDSPEALDALRRAIKRADDAELRLRAAEALGASQTQTIVKDLRPLLKDPDDRVQKMAKHVLATSEAISTEDIATMLDSKDDKQRTGAIAVLGARGGPAERRTLIEQLRGANNRIGEAVVEALEPMLSSLEDHEMHGALEDLRTLISEDELSDAGLAGRVVDLLSCIANAESAVALIDLAGMARDAGVKAKAITALRRVVTGKKPEQRIFRFLIEQVETKDLDPRIMHAAVDTLTVFDVPIALEARVRNLITSEQASVRRWALRALGALDTAPAAKALATAVKEGDATDRTIALEASLLTPNGRAALAKALATMTDPEKARAVASGLKTHSTDLTPSTLHMLEEAIVDADPAVAQVMIELLKHCGRGVDKAQETLLDKALRLKAKGQWADAAELFRRICQSRDADPEARYQLGICELKMSKRKITPGGTHDACVETFDQLTRARDFNVVDRLSGEAILEPEELYYLGFSLAEGKGTGQNLGGDILTILAEQKRDEKLAQMAKNKLQRMGWLE
jgi:HEAT repeat protein